MNYNKKRNFIIKMVGVIGILFLIFLIGTINNKKENNFKKEEIKSFLKQVDEICGGVAEDIEGNREKYLKLLETEKEPLKRGMYNSALSYISTITADPENILKYSDEAIKEYEKVKYGEFLAVAESRYLSWSMMRVGMYKESFSYANKTLNLLEKNTDDIFNDSDIIETESTIYSIFTIIYSEFKLKDNALYYYNKILELEANNKISNGTLEKSSYAKMCYGESVEDYEIIKREANKTYELALENDKRGNTNFADASFLNIALAEVKLGNLEEGIEKLKIAEIFFNAVNDEHSLGFCYVVYGDYYKQKNNYQLAREYYKKAVKEMEKINDKEKIKVILNELIDLGELEGIPLTEEYKKYYEIMELDKTESGINEVLEESLMINEAINKNRVDIIMKEKSKSITMNGILTMITIVLIILCGVISRLYKNRRLNEAKLEELINKDYLTGVRTRDYGFKMIDQLVKDKVNFSIAIVDIDNFKKINDNYGHILGDEVLKLVANKIKEAIGEENIVIRFGGEEFIVVFKNLSKEEGKFILDKVLKDLEKILIEDKVIVSFSGGVKNFIGDNIKKTIDEVDKLLYQAKHNGKNQIII
ncbi:MAG: tetratricopeptide repeat-containing diguanylate cyclase [Sarcina sp.]